MSGTLSSLTTALSALRHHQTAMDVASGNIANAGTDGYTRRRAIAESTSTAAVAALWSRTTPTGSGVQTASIDRIGDVLLDARARGEHALDASVQARAAAMARVEASTGEPSDTALAHLLGEFSDSWGDLTNAPSDPGARRQVVATGVAVTTALNAQARAVGDEWAGLRLEADKLAESVNGLATELASVNRSLNVATASGSDSSALMDKRDQLALRLSEMAGTRTRIEADGTATVTLGGQTVVDHSTTTAVTVSGATAIGDLATDPFVVAVGGTAVTPTTGRLGGNTALLTTDLPAHLASLDTITAGIVTRVNDLHTTGRDLDGDAGGPFFSGTTAATIAVAITDPRDVVASSAADYGNDVATAIGALHLDDEYRVFVTTVGATVSTLASTAATQSALVKHVDAAREAISGVNVDEETVGLIASQRSYEAASRVLSVMDQVLDTLINRTGIG